MIAYLIKRPIAVFITFFSLALLGVGSFFYLPTGLIPRSDIPEILVSIKNLKLTANELEKQITDPIRNDLLQVSNLEHIESNSSEGVCSIRLNFIHGTDISLAFIEVNDRIDQMMNRFSRDIDRPIITRFDIADIPIFQLNVFPKNEPLSVEQFTEMSGFCRNVICSRIEQLEEVAMVDVTGVSFQEILIEEKQGYLQTLGITANELIDAFAHTKININNILVKDGHHQFYLKFDTELLNIKDVENISVNVGGRIFKLRELADIKFATQEDSGQYYSNDARALNILILKNHGAKIDHLKSNFNLLISQMRRDYPNLSFELSEDQSVLLDFSISNLVQDLLFGGILALLLMLFFIRELKAAIIIFITIPLTLLLSLVGFYLLDISLNIISLGGLILGLGMIIDNSIVVVDSINSLEKSGEKIDTAIILGTNDVTSPLITAVFTNCGVFVPLLFLGGMAGALFYDQAISVMIGVLSSILVSILFIPVLYKKLHKDHNIEPEGIRKNRRNTLNFSYERGVSFVYRHPYSMIALNVIVLLIGVLIFQNIQKSRLPDFSRDETYVTIKWNEDIDLRENKYRTESLIKRIRPLVSEINYWLGEQQYLLRSTISPNYNEARIYLKTNNNQNPDEIRKLLALSCQKDYPNSILTFSIAENALDAAFRSRMAPLVLNIKNMDDSEMPKEDDVKYVINLLRSNLPKSGINPIEMQEKTIFKLNTYNLSLYNVDGENVVKKVEHLLAPIFIDNLETSNTRIPILLSTSDQAKSIHFFNENFVKNREQVNIPLNQLITISHKKEFKNITTDSNAKYYSINVQTENPVEDLETIRELLKKSRPGIIVDIIGSHFENIKLIRQMAIVLSISILLLYFILAAQFESLIQPLFILIELPLSISGALIVLYIGGNSINLMSLIGIVIMCGLIINDSILKIDAINQFRKKGYSLEESIHKGGEMRLRPIIMISLTSIGALLPTLFMNDLGSEIQKPLALTLIGGIIFGSLISLFFLPLLYRLIYQKPSE